MKHHIGRAFLAVAARVLFWTMKIEVRGEDNMSRALESGRPVIFALWHEGIASVLLLRQRLQLPPLLTMISRSKDGEIAASYTKVFATDCIRGSSSRGGARGLIQFINRLKEPATDGFAPVALHLLDGPRGPRYKAKPGILPLALKSNAMLLPLGIGLTRRIRFRSWDRHRLPLPFSRAIYSIGEPVDLKVWGEELGRDVTCEDLEGVLTKVGCSNEISKSDYMLA